MKPLVSIISVNYNQSAVTYQMIDSLKKCTFQNFEIIIVDNGSPNDKPEMIKEKYPEVNLIISKENLGFAGGNNLGVKEARGKFVLFLNNDTEVEAGFFEPLIKVFEENESIGMATPKIIYYGTDDIIQYAGAIAINPLTGRGRKIGHGEKDQGQYDQSRETDLAHGAALMIPMEVIKKVGLMPDIFFLYYEEHDWCEMVKRAGFKIMYVAESKIYHKESMSVGRNSPLKSYYMARNRLMFMRRNTTGMTFWIAIFFFMFLSFPKNILTHLLKREFKLLKTFIKGVWWNIHHAKVRQNPKVIVNADGTTRIFGCYKHQLIKF